MHGLGSITDGQNAMFVFHHAGSKKGANLAREEQYVGSTHDGERRSDSRDQKQGKHKVYFVPPDYTRSPSLGKKKPTRKTSKFESRKGRQFSVDMEINVPAPPTLPPFPTMSSRLAHSTSSLILPQIHRDEHRISAKDSKFLNGSASLAT